MGSRIPRVFLASRTGVGRGRRGLVECGLRRVSDPLSGGFLIGCVDFRWKATLGLFSQRSRGDLICRTSVFLPLGLCCSLLMIRGEIARHA